MLISYANLDEAYVCIYPSTKMRMKNSKANTYVCLTETINMHSYEKYKIYSSQSV